MGRPKKDKNVYILGIDISKRVFHLHGINKEGEPVLRKRLGREDFPSFIANFPSTTIVMEACCGANFWARRFQTFGHEVKLIHANFVKAFLKSNKNDMNDAEAIAEAASRPSMRFIPVKNLGQLEIQYIHRIRQRLVENRTALICQIRGILLEYGVAISVVKSKFKQTVLEEISTETIEMSIGMKEIFKELIKELQETEDKIAFYDGELMMISGCDDDCKRLETIPGVGYLSATAVVSAMGEPKNFKNGREFAAWLGLVPKQHSTGGKNVLLGISKRGDKYIRYLLVHGARSVVKNSRKYKDRNARWALKKWEEKGFNKATVALANKNARIIWSVMAKQESYKEAA